MNTFVAMEIKQHKLLFRLLEVFAWILFCMLPIVFLRKPPHENHHNISFSPIKLGLLFLLKNIKFVALFYVHYLYLIPRFFEKQQFKKYCIGLLIAFIIVASLPFLTNLFFEPFHHVNQPFDAHEMAEHHRGHYKNRMPMIDMGMHFFMTIIVLMLPLFISIYKKLLSVQKEKSDMELTFLKSQINHHFIFNSLNNIYSLSLQESNKTPNAVHDLSFIMRYVLDETIKEKTTLNKELEYIEHYISLQRIRLNEKIKLNYEVTGDANNLEISPMILIPFIENCFKHGLSTVQECAINIFIGIENKTLILKTENEIILNLNGEGIVSGIGIPNVLKRLEHNYKGKFTYHQAEKDNKYLVELKLNLS